MTGFLYAGDFKMLNKGSEIITIQVQYLKCLRFYLGCRHMYNESPHRGVYIRYISVKEFIVTVVEGISHRVQKLVYFISFIKHSGNP
jgi:hypothetical protein